VDRKDPKATPGRKAQRGPKATASWGHKANEANEGKPESWGQLDPKVLKAFRDHKVPSGLQDCLVPLDHKVLPVVMGHPAQTEL